MITSHPVTIAVTKHTMTDADALNTFVTLGAHKTAHAWHGERVSGYGPSDIDSVTDLGDGRVLIRYRVVVDVIDTPA